MRYLFPLVPFAFYLFTTAPGLAHADQAILIDAMYHARLASAATQHNWTILAGYVFSHFLPVGDLAYRCNLVSTFFGALTVAVFYLVASTVSRSSAVAVLASLLLMVSHSLWWHATVAEAYAVNAFFTVAVLFCLVRLDRTGQDRWLDRAALLAGLAVFNHVQMGFWLPGLFLVAWLRGRSAGRLRPTLGRAALWYAAGLLPYALLFLRDLRAAGSMAVAAGEALGGEFQGSFMSVWPPHVFFAAGADTARLFMLQWGWPSLFLLYAAVGAWRTLASPELALTNAAVRLAFVLNTGFFAFYPTWDKFAFLLPSFVLLAYVGLLGLKWLWVGPARRPRLRLVVVAATVAACAYAPWFFRQLPLVARQSPFWSSYAADPRTRNATFDGEFLAHPDKHDLLGVERYTDRVLTRLPPEAVLMDQIGRTFFQLTSYHQQLHGRRPDLRIHSLLPPGFAPARWPASLDTRQAVEAVAASPAPDRVFFTSVYGCDDVVLGLLRRGITLVPYRLDDEWTVFQARAASDLDLRSWFEDAVVTNGGEGRKAAVVLHFRRGNPPLRLRVVWEAGSRIPVSDRTYDIPFDVAPVSYARPAGPPGAPNRWTVRLSAFDQPLASVPFEIE